MNKLISVIIPIYNAEEFLADCIESVINQTYTNLEIILVNDGSNDLSEEICLTYKAKDTRIKYFFKANGGISSTRNFGLQHATGDYISFLDSDDFLDLDIYRKAIALLRTSEQKDKTLLFQYQDFGGKSNGNISPKKLPKQSFSKNEVLDLLANRKINEAVWNKIYPSHIVKSLSFLEGRLSEDAIFNFLALERSSGLLFLDEVGYLYRIGHSENALTCNRKRLHQDMLENCSTVLEQGIVLHTQPFNRFRYRHLRHIIRKGSQHFDQAFFKKQINSLSTSLSPMARLRYMPVLWFYYIRLK